MAVGMIVITHVTRRFSSLNMSTIFESSAQSQVVSGKTPGQDLQHSQPANEVHLTSTTVKHTTECQDLVALHSWLQTAPSGLLKLQNVSLKQTEALEAKLRQQGHKVRYVNVATELSCSSPSHLGTTGAAPITQRCSE